MLNLCVFVYLVDPSLAGWERVLFIFIDSHRKHEETSFTLFQEFECSFGILRGSLEFVSLELVLLKLVYILPLYII